MASGESKSGETAAEDSTGTSTHSTKKPQGGWDTYKVDMQSVNAASPVQSTFRKAHCIQSNIPRHCPCPFPPTVQGAVWLRL